MANSGINKFQVKKARETLLAQGINPSIDAVRVALGNTGSKATIHRYLKELTQEQPVAANKAATISDTLSALVESLAGQLEQEARVQVDEYQANHAVVLRDLTNSLEQKTVQLAAAEQTIQQLQAQLSDIQQQQAVMSEEHRLLQIDAGRLTQQLADKEVLLAEKATQNRSLEEKHQHTRDTLAHFRSAAKEQRDQEVRRHEHQVQQLQGELRQLNQSLSLKQTDITQLNKDNARWIAELSDARRHTQQLEQSLKSSDAQVLTTTASLAKLQHENLVQQTKIESMRIVTGELEAQCADAHTALITATTELKVKNQLFEQLGQYRYLRNKVPYTG